MKYAHLTLSGTYRDTGVQTKSILASSKPMFRFDEFLSNTERILGNRRIKRVVVEYKEDFSPMLFSGIEEIRARLLKLREAGKELHFFAKSYTPSSLYIASACSYRIIHPLGTLSFLGFAKSFLFFRQAMDRAGIDAQIVRRGKYKSAGDRFRTDRLDPANEEQYTAYFHTLMDEAAEKIQSGYNKNRGEIDTLLSGRLLDSRRAIDEGWADEMLTLGELEERWKKKEKIKKVSSDKEARSYSKGRKKIAVLFFEGAVVDGKTGHNPLIGQSIGSETFLSLVEKIRKKRSVKAVVLRINSGGGSATASEDILSSLERLAEEKPLVVSMSELAGSGGYWIACAGERVFASNTTLTGSIGVIMISFAIRDFLHKKGITESVVRTGDYADMGSPFRPVLEKERGLLSALIESHYRKFLEKVGAFRNKTAEDIHKIAEGRVWSGKDAYKLGLVDEIGGLEHAVSYLTHAYSLGRSKIVFYPEVKRSFIEKKLKKSLSSTCSVKGLTPGSTPLSVLSTAHYINRTPLAVLPEMVSFSPAGGRDDYSGLNRGGY